MRTMLALPTGRLILGDPSTLFGDARPLDVDLPAGRFPVTAGAERVELRVAAGEPETWRTADGFATPSGYCCLLDAAALGELTDLGDEPVDEYELLCEQLAGQPAGLVDFHGMLVFPAARAVSRILLGYGPENRICRIATELQAHTPKS
jgi:hypothetical protein